MAKNNSFQFIIGLTACLVTAITVFACGKKNDTTNCNDTKQTDAKSAAISSSESANKTENVAELNKKTSDDNAWCRSCVVGPAGFMSCQTVRDESAAQATAELREKARIKACVDSGFTEDNCPDSKIISLQCKGDPQPSDPQEAGKKMMEALRGSSPVIVTKDGQTIPNAMHKPPSGPGEIPKPSKEAEKSSEKDAPKVPII